MVWTHSQGVSHAPGLMGQQLTPEGDHGTVLADGRQDHYLRVLQLPGHAHAAYYRFHVTEGDQVEMQQSEPFPIQRAFTNRSIERLFAGWSGHRQFLAKDALSEVIMTR